MTPPRDGEKGGEVARELDAEWIASALRTAKENGADQVGMLLLSMVTRELARRNASLAAKDAEIAKLRADLAIVRRGIGNPAAMTPSLMAVEMQRLRLANVELRRTSADTCAWHGPYTGERTPCCVHQGKLTEALKETPCTKT